MLQSLISFGTFIGGVVLAFLSAFVVGFGITAGAAAFVWTMFQLEDKKDRDTDTRPGPSTVVNPVVEMKPTRTPKTNTNGSKPNV